MHITSPELPIGEFVFNGQSVHAVAVPLANLYLPAPHKLHAWPFVVAMDPVLHVHEVCTVLPSGESVLSGQAEHETATPLADLNLPTPHN